MMIPVVEHEGAHDLPPRQGEHLPLAGGETPGSGRGLLVEAAEERPRRGQRALQGRQESLGAGRAGGIEICRRSVEAVETGRRRRKVRSLKLKTPAESAAFVRQDRDVR